MKHLYYISRNFVEFGPFSPVEVADFKQRGILVDHDYVRAENNSHWKPIASWIKDYSPVAPKAKAVAKSKAAARKIVTPAVKTSRKAAQAS